MAFDQKHVPVILELLRDGRSNARFPDALTGNTSLHLAVLLGPGCDGQSDIVWIILDRICMDLVEIGTKNKDGQTALGIARTSNNKPAIARFEQKREQVWENFQMIERKYNFPPTKKQLDLYYQTFEKE